MDSLQEALTRVGAPFDEQRLRRLNRYSELIEETAGRLNITGVRGVERIQEELIIRSLRLLASAPGGFVSTAGWFDGRRVLDVGSGAGIPGIVLKIVYPEMRLALLDSSRKKCAFLERAAAELSLTDVEVINARAEEAAHSPRYREQFDLVVSRGVAALPELAELTLPFAVVGGTVISAKGLSGEREIGESEWAAGELGAAPAIHQVVGSPGVAPPDLLVYWLKIAPTPDRYPPTARHAPHASAHTARGGEPVVKTSPERQLSGDALRRGVFSLPTVAVTLVAGALLFLTLWRVFDVDWGELWDNVSSIDPLMYAAALVLYFLSFWFRGIRWRLISLTAGLERSANAKVPGGLKCGAIILMGWFANSVAFLRLGDAYRGWAMARESGAGFAPSLGTVLAERIQDMVVVLAMVLVAAAWVTAAGNVEVPGVVIIAAAALAAAMAALLLAMRLYWRVLSLRLPHKLRRFSQRFQLSTLRSFRGRDLPLQILLGIAGWMLEIGRFYFVAQGLDIEVGFGIVMFAALANAMLTTIPTPGGFGFVEGGLTGLLILVGIDDTNALSLTVVDRSISWLSVIVFGGLVFFGWHIYRGRSANNAA